jgi:hypothetical protein
LGEQYRSLSPHYAASSTHSPHCKCTVQLHLNLDLGEIPDIR